MLSRKHHKRRARPKKKRVSSSEEGSQDEDNHKDTASKESAPVKSALGAFADSENERATVEDKDNQSTELDMTDTPQTPENDHLNTSGETDEMTDDASSDSSTEESSTHGRYAELFNEEKEEVKLALPSNFDMEFDVAVEFVWDTGEGGGNNAE